MNTCDVFGCNYEDAVPIDSDSDLPEGWGALWLPDAAGEHQQSMICPLHVRAFERLVELGLVALGIENE